MSPSTVEISGPESVVNATEQIFTTRLNVNNAETNFSTETSYQQLNKLLTVLDEGPFKAEVTIRPVTMERIFDAVPVEILNLSENLEIKDELPMITLKLSGTMPVLENYIISRHAVQLNLREITEPGTYEIPLRYSVPANLTLVEKSDETLTITLVNRTDSDTNAGEEADQTLTSGAE